MSCVSDGYVHVKFGFWGYFLFFFFRLMVISYCGCCSCHFFEGVLFCGTYLRLRVVVIVFCLIVMFFYLCYRDGGGGGEGRRSCVLLGAVSSVFLFFVA